MSLRGFARAHDSGRTAFPAPPWLTWGALAGTTAGELLQVEYELARPALTGARLVLSDGRELAIVVLADRLEVLLPADTPQGVAIVFADLAGDGRSAVAELAVYLTGVATPTPVTRTGGLPRRVRRHRLVSSAPARARVTAAPSTLRRREPHRTAVARTLPGVRRVRSAPHYRGTSPAPPVRLLAGTGRIAGTHRGAGPAISVRAATAVGRRDGRALEEALLLDLL